MDMEKEAEDKRICSMLLGNHVKVKPKKQNFCVPSLKQNIVLSFFSYPSLFHPFL